jgi:hypothetical protein
MRIFSYTLAALVTIFIINIVLSFSIPSYRNTLVNIRSTFSPSPDTLSHTETVKIGEKENARLVESLDRIDKHIESLSEIKKINGTITNGSGIIKNNTGVLNNGSGEIIGETEGIIPTKPDIILSGIFLSKIMPEVTLKKVENDGFFGIKVMGDIQYSTYWDEKRKIKIYAFQETYNTFLLNMKLTSSVYKINETDQFF